MMSIREPPGWLLTEQGIKNGKNGTEDQEPGGLDTSGVNDCHVTDRGLLDAGIGRLPQCDYSF